MVARRRFVTVVYSFDAETMGWNYQWKLADVQEDIEGAVCWRCKKPGVLVDVEVSSRETPKANRIYHYQCIPPVVFRRVAGSLPARESSFLESPQGMAKVTAPTL